MAKTPSREPGSDDETPDDSARIRKVTKKMPRKRIVGQPSSDVGADAPQPRTSSKKSKAKKDAESKKDEFASKVDKPSAKAAGDEASKPTPKKAAKKTSGKEKQKPAGKTAAKKAKQTRKQAEQSKESSGTKKPAKKSAKKTVAGKTRARAVPGKPTESSIEPGEETRVVLMARDPRTVHAFWRVGHEDARRMEPAGPGGPPPLLFRLFEQDPADPSREVYRRQEVVAMRGGSTLVLPQAGGAWRAELGFIDESGRFEVLGQTPAVALGRFPGPESPFAEAPAAPVEGGAHAPRSTAPGEVEVGKIDDHGQPTEPTPTEHSGGPTSHWIPGVAGLQAVPGSEFLPGGAGSESFSPPGSEYFGVPGSEMMGGAGGVAGSPWPQPPGAGGPQTDAFRFEVWTEVIVRGATESDARVTCNGQPVQLDAEGRFALHFELPEGYHVFDLRATRADGGVTLRRVPVVLRRTESEG